MSMTISILGGVGLFLLGMTVMTGGLKTLAGPALRTVLGKAAATPLRGAFWGAVVTLLVQSSSATAMTTIGLVSAGLLTFPQGLGLVLGANVGTTGTGWLIALIGVRVSLTAAALPMIFVGALIKLLGRGRVSATGAALAGFALVLFGLTTLQQAWEGWPNGCIRRSAGCSRRPWRRVVGRLVSRVHADWSWARDDRGDAIVDRRHCRYAVRSLRRSRWAGSGLRADYWAKYWDGDQFRDGGDRCEQHCQKIGSRLHTVQVDCCCDRVGALSHRHTSPHPRLKHNRWSDNPGRLPHGV
jgi:hypothetical protein